jgi:hypothetical protein
MRASERKISTLFVCFAILLHLKHTVSFAQSDAKDSSNCVKYQVQDGDTISEVLKMHSLTPIYGKDGYLNKTYKIHAKENRPLQERIKRGDILCLPLEAKRISPTRSEREGVSQKEQRIGSAFQTSSKEKEQCIKYRFQKGDTLKDVLIRKNLVPLYGKNGTLEKTLKMNNRKMTSKIKEGELLCLAKSSSDLVNQKETSHTKDENSFGQKEENTFVAQNKNQEKSSFSKNDDDLKTKETQKDSKDNEFKTGSDKNKDLHRTQNRDDLNLEKKQEPQKELESLKEQKLTQQGTRRELEATQERKATQERESTQEREVTQEREATQERKATQERESTQEREAAKKRESEQEKEHAKELARKQKIAKTQEIEMEQERAREIATAQEMAMEREHRQEAERQQAIEKDRSKSHLTSSQEVRNQEIKNLTNIFAQNSEAEKKTEKAFQCYDYIVKEGESLVQILRKHALVPIYGPKGSLLMTLKANKNISHKNSTLQEGEKLCLRETSEGKKPLSEEALEKATLPNLQKFYFGGGISYLRLIGFESDDRTTGILLSKPMSFIETGLAQNWTPRLNSTFGINYTHSRILESADTIIIGDPSLNLINFYLEILYRFLPQVYGEFKFGYGDEMVYRSITTLKIRPEKLPTSKIKFLGGIKLLEFGGLQLEGQGAFSLNAPFFNEIYKAQIGKGFEFAAALKYEGEGWNSKLRWYYERHYTSIPPVIFDYTETGLTLRFTGELP